jgi:hypothetical protein
MRRSRHVESVSGTRNRGGDSALADIHRRRISVVDGHAAGFGRQLDGVRSMAAAADPLRLPLRVGLGKLDRAAE